MRIRLAMGIGLLVLGLAGGGTALAARTSESSETLRWLYEETSFVVVLANGTRRDPHVAEAVQPQPGDQFFFTGNVFATEDGKTKGDKIGTDNGMCTSGIDGYLFCTVTTSIGEDQLRFAATFVPDFEAETFEVDFAITGGTGKFRDAGGQGHVTEQHGADFALVEVDLLHLAGESH